MSLQQASFRLAWISAFVGALALGRIHRHLAEQSENFWPVVCADAGLVVAESNVWVYPCCNSSACDAMSSSAPAI